jgi:pSer/pThr/pTyr-binding forkhead associated (FHA) protein
VITLALLHPIGHKPLRTWTFDLESIVRIGRSRKNDVVIASAVVSRHHIELWCNSTQWEIVNFGSNGTYVEGKRIDQVPVKDGMVIRLGTSGPQLRLQVDRTQTVKAGTKSQSDIIATQT